VPSWCNPHFRRPIKEGWGPRIGIAGAAEEWLHGRVSEPVVPIVYVKTGCPWCDDVLEYLDGRKMPYRKVVVSGNAEAFQEMINLSGQRKAPTMDWDGEVLADFGVEELVEFLAEKGLA
jgi:glutaredoxin